MKARVILLMLCMMPYAKQAFSLPAISWESAQIPPERSMYDLAIMDRQFAGTRLFINESVIIHSLGAYLYGIEDDTTLFMALVALGDESALPNGSPLDDNEVLAYSTFQVGRELDDYFATMDVTLAPGYYGIIIGSGLYGASGNAGLPSNCINLPGSSYFVWNEPLDPYIPYSPASDNAYWREWDGGDVRFTMQGVAVIPEPATPLLLILGAISLAQAKRKKKCTTMRCRIAHKLRQPG